MDWYGSDLGQGVQFCVKFQCEGRRKKGAAADSVTRSMAWSGHHLYSTGAPQEEYRYRTKKAVTRTVGSWNKTGGAFLDIADMWTASRKIRYNYRSCFQRHKRCMPGWGTRIGSEDGLRQGCAPRSHDEARVAAMVDVCVWEVNQSGCRIVLYNRHCRIEKESGCECLGQCCGCRWVWTSSMRWLHVEAKQSKIGVPWRIKTDRRNVGYWC